MGDDEHTKLKATVRRANGEAIEVELPATVALHKGDSVDGLIPPIEYMGGDYEISGYTRWKRIR